MPVGLNKIVQCFDHIGGKQLLGIVSTIIHRIPERLQAYVAQRFLLLDLLFLDILVFDDGFQQEATEALTNRTSYINTSYSLILLFTNKGFK